MDLFNKNKMVSCNFCHFILFLLVFFNISIYANEKWIRIEAINKTQTSKKSTTLDLNLSQIEPINKMMKNVKVIKQLIDATNKKEKPTTNGKNWFILNSENLK